MLYYMLRYEVVEDYVVRRQPHREDHFGKAREAVARGELMLGGVVGEPVSEAWLLFRGAGPEIAEEFARTDPYVLKGLVRQWRVIPWNVVIGTAHVPEA